MILDSGIIFSLSIYTILLLVIAYWSNLANKNVSDYMLGGRSLSGPVTALGAGASDMSGWLLLGLPGAAYLNGAIELWMAVALVIGSYFNWVIVAKRLRIFTEYFDDALTIPQYLQSRFTTTKGTALKVVIALIFIIFFTIYSASGLVGGALLTKNVMNVEYTSALYITVIVITSYTALGGFLAINRVDFFQGLLMLFSLIVVPVTTYVHLRQPAIVTWDNISPYYTSPWAGITLGLLISKVAWGLGYFGQPHILVRFMAVRSVKDLPIARRICISWMVLSLVGAILTGMLGRLLYPELINDPEVIFILAANKLFSSIVTGVLLSAVLSAIMSTVSALLLMSASALVGDLLKTLAGDKISEDGYLLLSRVAVGLVAVAATVLALSENSRVLHVVAFAWSGLGAAFGPVILCSLYKRNMSYSSAIVGILVGAVFVLGFRITAGFFPGYWLFHYTEPGIELLPGFMLSALVIFVMSAIAPQDNKTVIDNYDRALDKLNAQ